MSDTESENSNEYKHEVKNVSEIIHDFLMKSSLLDKIADYICKTKYGDVIRQSKEDCVVCLKNTECKSRFLSSPFCKTCTAHLYNGDIDISKSMKEHSIIWKVNKNVDFDKE